MFQTFSIAGISVGGFNLIPAGAFASGTDSSSFVASGVFRLPKNLSIFDAGGVPEGTVLFLCALVEEEEVLSSILLVTDGGRRLLGGLI